MGTSDSLIEYARAFAKAKAATLETISSRVATRLRCWLSDMLVAAEAGDANRVHRIAGRTNAQLKDAMAHQLH
jgi:hypothetical protein